MSYASYDSPAHVQRLDNLVQRIKSRKWDAYVCNIEDFLAAAKRQHSQLANVDRRELLAIYALIRFQEVKEAQKFLRSEFGIPCSKRWLKKVYIRYYTIIQEETMDIAKAVRLDLTKLFATIYDLLSFDPADIVDENGKPLPLHQIPERTRKALAQVTIKNRGTATQYKFVDRTKLIEALLRFSLFAKYLANPDYQAWTGANEESWDNLLARITQGPIASPTAPTLTLDSIPNHVPINSANDPY